jgi:4-carboxymuconolactone decarboxylase
MSDPATRRALGLEKLKEIARVPAFEPPDAFTAATIDSVFGELWSRPGLPTRDRRIITLAIVGTRGMEFEIETHVRAALASRDLSPGELVELILQLAYYAGWPCASVMYRRFRAVCDELGLEVPALQTER